MVRGELACPNGALAGGVTCSRFAIGRSSVCSSISIPIMPAATRRAIRGYRRSRGGRDAREKLLTCAAMSNLHPVSSSTLGLRGLLASVDEVNLSPLDDAHLLHLVAQIVALEEVGRRVRIGDIEG